MNKKRIIWLTIIYTAILLFIIFNPFSRAETANGLLMDIVKDSAEVEKPFVEESLIYSYAFKETKPEEPIENGHILLTKEEIVELRSILSSTQVEERSNKINFISIWEEENAGIYSITMTNRGYTIPTMYSLAFMFVHMRKSC